MSPRYPKRLLIGCFLGAPILLAMGEAETKKKNRPIERIGDHAPRQVLKVFGYRGIEAVTDRQMANYRRVFGFLDLNRDKRHSKKEYVEDGIHLNRQARQGIFRAADANHDGFVSEAEYVENRIITDEAKEIFYEMDANRDDRLTLKELVASGKFKDGAMAKKVFQALDANGDGELVIPEYLRTWGRWARSQPRPAVAPGK